MADGNLIALPSNYRKKALTAHVTHMLGDDEDGVGLAHHLRASTRFNN